MRRVLFGSYRDTCNCPYSFYGCSGLSCFLDGLFWCIYGGDEKSMLGCLAKALDDIAASLHPSCSRNVLDSMAPGVLGFIASWALHITHTCACHTHSTSRSAECERYPDDELAELRYIEGNLLQMQEQLMEEFLLQYRREMRHTGLLVKAHRPGPFPLRGRSSEAARNGHDFDRQK